MPFTRQRHHGMNETLASTSHLTNESHPAHHIPSAHKTHSSQAIQHRTTRRATRHTGTLALSLVTAAFSHVPAAFARKPNRGNRTAPSHQPVAKPTGVWGWTSGAQTYLRSRPGALTAPVAKVDKHTKLFVWGKFDGWYRVETPDHVFGWVYHSYINSPDEAKLQEISHYKAKLASDRTASQPMYGSTRLLQHQYALYKAPGAAQALAAQGVRVAIAPPRRNPAHAKASLRLATRPAPKVAAKRGMKSTLRVATRPTVRSATPKTATPNAEAPQLQNVSVVTERYASRDFGGSHNSASAAPLADMNEVGTVRFAPPLTPSRRPTTQVAPSLSNNRTGQQTPATNAAPATVPQPGTRQSAPATAASEATRPRRVAPPTRNKPAPKLAPVKAMAKPAPLALAQATVIQAAAAPVKPPAAPSIRSQRRLAALLRRQRATAARREQLRVKMGNPATMVPPVASPQLAPISPSDLLKARDSFLASQAKNASGAGRLTPDTNTPALPNGSNAIVAPSSLTRSGAPAAQPSRGGSPRDYARAAALNHARFGDALAGQALTYRGFPYIRGAQSPRNGFDCSGLLYYLLRQRGYNPPRSASGYAHYGQAVSKDKLQPGDILLFANTYKRGISHVAIYMGNDRFVHAANSGRGVTTDVLSSPYYASKFYGARRVK